MAQAYDDWCREEARGNLMTEQEIKSLLEDIADRSNDAIDKLIVDRNKCEPDKKASLRYVTKKLEIIVGACNRALDNIAVV